MFKKALAMLLAGSMVMSSATVAMAGESVETEVEVASEETVESTETAESEEAAASEETAESTETTESADTAEAENDSDEFRALVKSMLTDIEKAVEGVDLEKKEEALGKEFSEEGTVFSLFEKILKDIDEKKSAAGKEVEDFLQQALGAFNSLEETDEKELDGILELALLGLISDEVEEDIADDAAQFEIANLIANFVFETAKENKLIAEAVEATDSKLFDMLSNSSVELKAVAKDDGTMDVDEDIPEEPFEQFEEELAKVTDYINEQDGPKQAALDILNLVHDIVDEIHLAVHGHTHETEAENDSVDYRALVQSMVTDIEKAAEGVDLEKKEEVLGKEFSEEGTVFSLFEKILKDVNEKENAEGKETKDSLKQALDAFNSLEETEEQKLDGILELVLLGLFSDEAEEVVEEEPEKEASDIEIANLVANFVFETAKENKLIAEAVEATGSKLFDMLSNSSAKLEAAAKDDGTIAVAEDIPEEPFEQFEEEVAKVKEYINGQDGPKQAALDLLNLVHEIVDEIHLAVHGHTHEAAK